MRDEGATSAVVALDRPREIPQVCRVLDRGEVRSKRVTSVRVGPVVFCVREERESERAGLTRREEGGLAANEKCFIRIRRQRNLRV
jgi:hypothetical protein